MTNYIYLVAGERNTKPGSVSDSGGLYANVGMTHNGRLPEDRFRDPDYKKKQSGGSWVLIKQWAVGDMKDHSIHNFLKRHDDVRWNPISHNTEEFLFIGDEGDGLKAVNIIEHIMLEHLMPSFIKEKLSATQAALTEERNKREYIENAEPWLLLQEALTQQEEVCKAEHDKRLEALERDNDIHLALKEAQLRNTVDERLNEAMAEAKKMVELAQKEVKNANDNSRDLTIQRDQAILRESLWIAKSKSRTRLSVLSMALGFVCALTLGTEAFSNMASDEIALAEHALERSNQAVLASNSKAKELYLEINRLTRENNNLKQTLTKHQQKIVKAQSAKAKLHKQICLTASSCVGDDQVDNAFVCSVYKGPTRYECRYTVEGRLPSCSFESCYDGAKTITLKNGNAYTSDYDSRGIGFKIVKYETYGTPQ